MSQKKWFYLNASLDRVGPISSKALKSLADNGVIVPTTPLLTEEGKLVDAACVKGLFPVDSATTSSTLTLSGILNAPPVDSAITPSTLTSSGILNAPPIQSPPPSSPKIIASVPPQPPPVPSVTPKPILPENNLWDSAVFVPAKSPSQFDHLPLWNPATQFPPPHAVADSGVYVAAIKRNQSDPFVAIIRLIIVVVVSIVTLGIIVRVGVYLSKESSFASSAPIPRQPILPDPEDPPPAPDPPPPPVVRTDPAPIGQRKTARPTEEIVAEVEHSIALILGKEGSGTGFVVLPGIIATNSHVIAGEELAELELSFPSENGAMKGPFKPQLLYEDPDRDLAFLQIPTFQHRPIPTVKDYKFRRGQKIIAIGNPGRGDGGVLENAVCEGILSTQTDVDDKLFYQLSIAVNPGNSGGPVLDGDGCALGVVTLKAKIEGTAYCIPPDELNKAIELVRKKDSAQIQKHREMHKASIPFFRGLQIVMIIKDIPPPKQLELAQKALLEFDEAIKRAPDNAMAYFFRGLLKLGLGKMNEVMADLDQAVKLAPNKKEIADVRNEIKKEIDQSGALVGRGRRPSSPGPGAGLDRFRSHFGRGGSDHSSPGPGQTPHSVPSSPGPPPPKQATFFDEVSEN